LQPEFNYEIGDIVKFNLTSEYKEKVFTGVIVRRFYARTNLKIYQVSCLERGMNMFSIIEQLIIDNNVREGKNG
jgi:hypothetical protein